MTRTAIILFTDLVDSTATMVRLGARVERHQQAHFGLLRAAVTATGGREVKNLGDGLMVAFDGAGAALACAASIQAGVERFNRRSDVPLGIRVGISCGDVTEDADGDLFGLPVVEAARLCALAEAHEILLTPVVRSLVGTTTTDRFTDLGEQLLKGLEGPTAVLRLEWAPDPHGVDLALPAQVRRALEGPPTIGREDDLSAAEAAWEAAAAGARHLVLVDGEPGAGKTRLVAEAARRAALDGALVLFGRCDPDVRAPLRPWATAMESLVHASAAKDLAEHVAAHGAELTRLVPRLPATTARTGVDRLAAGDDEAARRRLLDACSDLLTRAARRRPVVLVLDDLHWADRATLALLRHVLGGDDAPLLVLGTARDADIDRDAPFVAFLPDLARDPATRRLHLAGLDAAATRALAVEILGATPETSEVAAAVHAEAEGNPLFTIELLRFQRGRGGAADGLPTTIRDVVGQRVAALGDVVGPVLAAAALLGRTFHFATLPPLLDAPEEQVLDALERAVAAALISERPGDPGWFTFSHALVQRVFADSLSSVRAARLHRRAAELLDDEEAGDPRRAGEAARHWLAAGASDRARAIAACRRAADRALILLAPDEAADWLDQALHLHRADADVDPRRTAELLLVLGDAERRAGRESYRRSLLDAAAVAREAGEPDLLIEAALANSSGLNSSFLERDDERIAILRSALLVVADDDPRRARLLAVLASELWRDREQRLPVANSARDAARRSGDPAVIVEVLYRRCLTIAEPATTGERLALTDELAPLADDLDVMWRLRVAAERMRVCMEVGRGEEGVVLARRLGELAPLTGSAMARYMAVTAESWLLARSGDYVAAEERAQEAAQLGAGVAPDAFAIFSAQLLPYRWDRGQLGELVDLARMSATAEGALSSQRAILPLALHEAGDADGARTALDAALADGLPIDLDTLTGVTAVLWAEGAARTGHAEAAAVVLERVGAWTEQVAFSGVSLFGSIARPCALLAALLGDAERARALFATAERLDRATGAVGPLARTLADHAEWLVRDGDAGGRRRLAEAAELAERHGLAGIAAQCAAAAAHL